MAGRTNTPLQHHPASAHPTRTLAQCFQHFLGCHGPGETSTPDSLHWVQVGLGTGLSGHRSDWVQVELGTGGLSTGGTAITSLLLACLLRQLDGGVESGLHHITDGIGRFIVLQSPCQHYNDDIFILFHFISFLTCTQIDFVHNINVFFHFVMLW